MSASPYRERLLPGWWVWLVGLGLVTMVAVAYGAALGATVGWLVALGGVVVGGALIWSSAPVVGVTTEGVRAAGALLPHEAVGGFRVVGPDEIAALCGSHADARIFAVLRPSSAPGGLLIDVDDDDDPHPAWLLTSRHPERLAAVLTATMDHPDRTRLEE